MWCFAFRTSLTNSLLASIALPVHIAHYYSTPHQSCQSDFFPRLIDHSTGIIILPAIRQEGRDFDFFRRNLEVWKTFVVFASLSQQLARQFLLFRIRLMMSHLQDVFFLIKWASSEERCHICIKREFYFLPPKLDTLVA